MITKINGKTKKARDSFQTFVFLLFGVWFFAFSLFAPAFGARLQSAPFLTFALIVCLSETQAKLTKRNKQRTQTNKTYIKQTINALSYFCAVCLSVRDASKTNKKKQKTNENVRDINKTNKIQTKTNENAQNAMQHEWNGTRTIESARKQNNTI